jgi:PAS domain S-box-containing protein
MASLPRNGFRLAPLRDALGRITDFTVVEASAAVAKMVRRTVADVTGLSLRHIFNTPRIDGMIERFSGALEDGLAHTDEYPVLTDALAASWVRQTVVRDGADQLLVTVEDLSAERLAAVQREVSGRLRELLFERAPAGIVLLGPDGRITEANAAFAQLMHAEPAALTGLRLPDHSDCTAWGAPQDRAYTCRLQAIDGTWRPVSVIETPLPHGYRQLVVEDRSEIEASEQRYRAALHAAGLTAWEMHQATERLVVSDSYRTLFDLPADAPLPTTIAELRAMVHPDDRERIRVGRMQLSEAPGDAPIPFETEYRIITPSGEVRWMRTRGELTRAHPGDPGIIYAITRDISRLIGAEMRLRESEEQFRSAFDESAIGMALITNDGRTLRVNSALAEMFGYPLEEAMTTQWHQILHPEEVATAGAILREIAVGRLSSSRAERRCLHRNGTLVWTQMTVAGVGGDESIPEQLIVQIEDITERKLADAAQHAAEERLALVLEATRDGIWDWDIPTGRIHYGPQWFGMLGYPAEGQVGDLSVFSQLVHQDDQAALWPIVERHLAAPGTEYDVTFRMRHAAGYWVWIRARGRAVARDAEGRATRMVGTHTDVTHERQLEEQVRHSQKMDAIGKLAGGVAHDFNNLLTAIGATTEMLLADSTPAAPAHDDLERIALAAARAKALTRQLLSFSRQEIEQMADVPVDAVVAKIAPLLQRLLEPSQAMVVDLQTPGVLLHLDPANLELALLNLVANARDAMPDGGTVTIQTTLREGPGERSVRITVRDTGVGMTAVVRERLFEPFFTTKPQGKGTGLGMPTVYGFVQRLGGRIDVETAPGAGTAVHLILPSPSDRSPLAPMPTTSTVATEPRQVRRVLLVDDEAFVRQSTQRLLERRGIEVVAVESADHALAALDSEGPFDVVLSDHAMPGRTGHQLIEAIAARNPAQRVVLMSGFADDDSLRRTLGNREIPFLAKPFTLAELMEALGA